MRYNERYRLNFRTSENVMTIGSVIKEKGVAVFSTSPDAVIGEIIKNFAANKAGSLMVIDRSGLVIGLLTERDIVQSLGELGAETLSLHVSSVMTKLRIRCSPDDTVSRALELMARGKTRYLPVVDNGCLSGVVSIVDLVEWQNKSVVEDNDWMKGYMSSDYCISYNPSDNSAN